MADNTERGLQPLENESSCQDMINKSQLRLGLRTAGVLCSTIKSELFLVQMKMKTPKKCKW